MSENLGAFLALYGSLITGFLFIGLTENLDLECFNPIRNYNKHKKLNWLGVTLFTLLMHLIYPIYAFIYWFTKLITIGRKQGNEDK